MCDQTKKSDEEKEEVVEEEEGSIFTHHSIEVNVEILDFSKGQKKATCAVDPVPKCPSSTLQRVVGKKWSEDTPPRNLSHTSVMSETTVEEMRRLREDYSSQLRRINYVSHEPLGQAADPGLLACIREPLRSLRLPCGPTFGQTARGLWTRLSSWRKLMKMSPSVSSSGPNMARRKILN